MIYWNCWTKLLFGSITCVVFNLVTSDALDAYALLSVSNFWLVNITFNNLLLAELFNPEGYINTLVIWLAGL